MKYINNNICTSFIIKYFLMQVNLLYKYVPIDLKQILLKLTNKNLVNFIDNISHVFISCFIHSLFFFLYLIMSSSKNLFYNRLNNHIYYDLFTFAFNYNGG